MGKGGSRAPAPAPAPAPTQQTITQTDLPDYARPYYENLMSRAQAESYRGYEPYGGERISGFDPMQIQAQDAAGNMQRPDQIGQATDIATQAGLGGLGATYDAQNQSFTQPGVAGNFMSPYMQNVVDRQKQEAMRDASMIDLNEDLGAARRGTYGGSRQLLASLERERNLQDQMGDIQAQGLQSSFDQAQRQFNTEEQARMQNEQFGAGFGLQGLGLGLQGAQTIGALGETQQATDLQRIQAQAAAGAERQGLEQQYLDTAYGDFLRQRDYPKEQLNFFNAQLRGVPMPSLSSTNTAYAQPPSIASQVGGLGLAGLGLYNMYNS